MPASLEEVHEKAKSYDWPFSVGDQRPKFESKYVIPPKGRDPFRTLVRDYLKMEAEKDDRTHGFLDAAVRLRVAERTDPRFLEVMKVTLTDLTLAEFQAVSACGMLISSVPNQEIRQGYQAQMMDEMRHAQLEMALRHYYVKHAPDPAGFDIGQKALYELPGGLIGVGAFAQFNCGDPIDAIINLNVVLETAYTNPLLVATPQIAVANGDDALATTFLSIQSDEARHMANGYGSLMAVLSVEQNIPLVNEALERSFWIGHRQFDALSGFTSEYGATVRPWAYRDQWDEWIGDDFISSYLERLTPFGVKVPSRAAKAAQDVNWLHHTTALALAAIWPLNFWRTPVMRQPDFDWFEKHYPGWYGYYGQYWEGTAALADPAGGRIMLQEFPALPPLCQVCQLPCVMPRLDIADTQILSYQGAPIAVCSEGCAWVFQKWPTVYAGRKQFWSLFHGWDLADVIIELGLLREDGKTLVGQPSIELERMWTIDDIRKLGYEVKDPLHAL